MELSRRMVVVALIQLVGASICLGSIDAFLSPIARTTTTKSFRTTTTTTKTKTTTTTTTTTSSRLILHSSDGDWLKDLENAASSNQGMLGEGGGAGADSIIETMRKMRGLNQQKQAVDPKRSANSKLVDWLQNEGDVWLSELSGWGVAPHPMAIATETKDEVTNESSGRGLLARTEIEAGDELFAIPIRMCFTKKSARQALGEDALPESINEYLAIACQLIREKYVLGDESFYAPYIAVLPEVSDVSPTFTWPDEDLEYLNGSPVVAATKSLHFKLKREFEALLGGDDGLMAKFPDRFPKEHYTLENWLWAFTMLFSRAIRLRNLKEGESLAMVPYADLINHSPASQAYIDARETGDWLVKTGEEEVILYADRGYRTSDQIYISYGPKPNADLLLLYGFAVERNPFNSVDVTVAIAPRSESFVKAIADAAGDMEVDPLAEEKVAFLEKVGRDQLVDFPCYADRYPQELLEYLRMMQMTPEDTRGKPLTEFDYTRTVSAANEASVLQCVVEAIKRQIGNYPTTEEQDADIIRDKTLFRTLNYNQRMAVRHRRNEKRLLKRTIAAMEKQMAQQGLDKPDVQLARAEGNTLGQLLPGDEKKYGMKQKTALEDRLEKMGLPVDLR